MVLGIGLALVTETASAGTVRSAPAAAHAASQSWHLRFGSSRAGLGYLSSVAALNAKDVWAAGTSAPVNYPTGALVMHWDGLHWNKVRIAQPTVFGPATVAASSVSNVWLFGTWILRWDGRRWHRMPSPPAGPSSGQNSPVVLSASNVWMYGVELNPPGAKACRTTLWHWNGRKWLSYPIAGFCGTGLSASSWRNVWLVGTQGPAAPASPNPIKAFRWVRQSWRAVSMPHPQEYGAVGFTLPDVVAASPGEVWIGNDKPNVAFPYAMGPGFALRWTGHSWTRTASSGLATNQGIAADGHGGLWMGPDGHWTGQTWLDTTPGSGFSPDRAYRFAALARVPGTGTIWGVGSITASGGSDPMTASFGPVP
jgi:hypothetical protein